MAGEGLPAAAEPCVEFGDDGPQGRGGRPGSVRWSKGLADRLLTRVAAGEMLYAVLREAGMPTPPSVGRWAKERPGFGTALAQARALGGRARTGGGVSLYCPGIAEEVFERMCEGESLTTIGGDPTMPCLSTLFRWRRTHAEFEDLMQLGMRIRAERFVDRAEDLSEAATTETAYLTHVRLTHLRWAAGTMAPRVFRTRMVEPEKPPEPPKTYLLRRFEVETDPETGRKIVVGYCPNPFTGEVEREDTPGWLQPGDENVLAVPGWRRGGQPYRPPPGTRP